MVKVVNYGVITPYQYRYNQSIRRSYLARLSTPDLVRHAEDARYQLKKAGSVHTREVWDCIARDVLKELGGRQVKLF